jgi:hypothetical protein
MGITARTFNDVVAALKLMNRPKGALDSAYTNLSKLHGKLIKLTTGPYGSGFDDEMDAFEKTILHIRDLAESVVKLAPGRPPLTQQESACFNEIEKHVINIKKGKPGETSESFGRTMYYLHEMSRANSFKYPGLRQEAKTARRQLQKLFAAFQTEEVFGAHTKKIADQGGEFFDALDRLQAYNGKHQEPQSADGAGHGAEVIPFRLGQPRSPFKDHPRKR